MADLLSAPPARHVAAPAHLSSSRRLIWPGVLLAFAASCATLVLELVANRLLAPFIGVSLYTWTAIIGVVLTGVSLGNWVGGRLADRHPSANLLSVLFILSGLASLAALVLVWLLGDGAAVRPLPLLARIFLLSTLVFLPPSLLLGMVTPPAIRLALPDVGSTGRVVGLIYAAGTVGSLAGNFLTGFVLTALFPVNAIVTAVGVALLTIGLLLRLARWRQPGLQHSPKLEPALANGSTTAPGRRRPEETKRQGGLLELAGNVRLACLVVVVASFCTMAIELAASRIMAPAVGLSLYSWTGIFGAVLAGIAVGNYLGGRVADRWPGQQVLGFALFLGGMGSLSILLSVDLLEAGGLFRELGLMGRVVLLTAAIFFLPVLLLGTISPQVIRLVVTDLDHAGRVSGQVYAWSTIGAVIGTFVTGWWLISAVGVFALVFSMGIALVALGLLIGRFWRRPIWLAALVVPVALSIAGLSSRDALASACTRETNYFCIKVHDGVRDGGPVKTLVLDHLVHSYVRLGDPSYLGYEHEYIQAEITRFQLDRTAADGVLVIGGGGYTFPRWVEAMLPQARVEVVEIDPGVTEVVHDELGLPRDTRIVSYNLDGRQFVHELAPKGGYSVVVQDAVNDLSVPYHIMTREYNDQVRDLLAPGGMYLLTVIDLYEDGQLLRAAARTMMETFPNVQLLAPTRTWDTGGAAVWVVAGSDDGLDLRQLESFLQAGGHGRMRTLMLEPERLKAYVDAGPQIVLTDQYAPVDNLIAPLFTRRG